MKTIVAPISPSDRNDVVINLQLALTALGFAIANEERIAGFFGDTTFNSMQRFQELFQIPITTYVDEQTATTLSEILRDKQLLDKDFRVSGHVWDGFERPIMQATVVTFDVDLRGVPLVDKVLTISEAMQSSGFQWLGSTVGRLEKSLNTHDTAQLARYNLYSST
jgi:peptidoglycan hydrolase-like protein with peptidoglycan-binding domain